MKIRKWVRRFRRKFEPRGIVLMYHRIAEINTDPWQLAVQPDHFEEQLIVLKKKFNVIPVSDLVNQLTNKTLKSKSVAITFDDGYNDNFVHARPLLEKYHCPASFFIATKFIGTREMFWWDELQNIFFETAQLPAVFAMEIGDSFLELTLGHDATLTPEMVQLQQHWAYYEDPPTRRCWAYHTVWEKMRPLPYELLRTTMTRIQCWADHHPHPDPLSIPLSDSELASLGDNPLFELGLHTESHASLSSHPWNIQQMEICGNREYLKNVCAYSKQILTYPYGDYDETTQRVARNELLAGAFTTHESVVTHRSDLYSLGRFHVKNWNGDEFECRLRDWIKPT
jgi:peptidoglycan/xylan/chitin deacetylase (PgdA/CDA1 family)